jgi:hypothetical protein
VVGAETAAEWLLEQEVEEAAMKSTAQYWEPVWGVLKRYWKPMRQGGRRISPMPSSVCGGMMRRKYQRTRNRVPSQHRVASLLEDERPSFQQIALWIRRLVSAAIDD